MNRGPHLIDFYHSPLTSPSPAVERSGVIETSWKSYGSCPESRDRISQLPLEIQDEIFSLLGLSALEAARGVCLAWRNRISSSSWILREALHGAGIKSQRLDGASEELRYLKKQMRNAGGAHYDAWNARYTTNSAYFLFSKQIARSSLATCPATVACLPFGHLIAFITCSDSSTADSKFTLLLFHIFRTGQPTLIAAISLPSESGAPWRIKIRQDPTGQRPAWTVEVIFPAVEDASKVHSTNVGVSQRHARKYKPLESVGTLRLVLRPSFAKEESPFEPPERLLVDKTQSGAQGGPATVIPIATCNMVARSPYSPLAHSWPEVDPQWILLEPLPTVPGPSLILSLCPALFLAKHAPSKDVFLVRLNRPHQQNEKESNEPVVPHVTPVQSLQSVTPLALLSCPYCRCAYLNLALAPVLRTNASRNEVTLRVAIIWHDPQTSLPVLFVYEVPLPRLIYANSNSSKSPSAYTKWGSPPTGQRDPPIKLVDLPLPDSGLETREITVGGGPKSETEFEMPILYGNRIRSLSSQVGGLHWSIRHEDTAAFQGGQTELGGQANVGGLKLPEDGHQQCLVWGPSPVSEGALVGLHVLSINFARELFFHDYMFWHYPWPLGRHHYARGQLGVCSCPLHDKVFHVTLPVRVDSAPSDTSSSSLASVFSHLPRAEPPSSNGKSFHSSITLVETPEQIQARERYESESSAFAMKLEMENQQHAKGPVPYRFRISLHDPAVTKSSWWRVWG